MLMIRCIPSPLLQFLLPKLSLRPLACKKLLFSKIKLFGLSEIAWFALQPIYNFKAWPIIFLQFSLFSKVFIRIDEYAILNTLISAHCVTIVCHSIKLVPRLVIKDCKQLRFR